MRAISSSVLLATTIALFAPGCADGEDPTGFQPDLDASSEASKPDGSAGAQGKDAAGDTALPSEAGVDSSDAQSEAAAESGVDAESDAVSEASTDAPLDVLTDSGAEAGQDAAFEAGPDAPMEAAVDAPIEASVDAPWGDASALAPIHITEVYVDVAVKGDPVEWVAIAAEPGTPIGDLKLRHFKWVSSTEPIELKFDLEVAPSGTVMPSSGYWVIGGYLSPADQLYLGYEDWGLDSSSGMVQLYRTTASELLDAVGYGSAQPVDAPSAPLMTMEGTAAKLPPGGTTDYSIARRPGGTWHDDSMDFCAQLATPKADNPGVCQ